MTFYQARAVSRTNFLHVRRVSWPQTRWFIVWRGVWFVFDAGIVGGSRVVTAADYSKDDLAANDWTTVPAPLMSCPIIAPTPGDPGSPGGVPPGPTFPGFPPIVGGDGGGGGGGAGGIDDPPLPPPNTRGMSVTFNGLTFTNPPTGPRLIDDISGLNNDPFDLTRSAPGTWVGYRSAGMWAPDPDGFNIPMVWKVIVVAPTYGDVNTKPYPWNVTLVWLNNTMGIFVGGFLTTLGTGQPAGNPINNAYHLADHGHGVVADGTATVTD